MTDAGLAALGIHRIPVPVPFPQAGGPVNVYALEDEGGGLCLWDSGLGSPEGIAAVLDGLAALGRSPADVRRIYLSHGHVDHYGAALALMERRGAPVPVHVHPADHAKVAASAPGWREQAPHYAAHLARLGVPPDVLAALAREVGAGFTLARRLPEVRAALPGERLSFARFEAELVHMPGHTPGLLCLWDAAHGLFFSADHLLEKVSPNPIIELGPNGEEGAFHPLLRYVESLARLRALPVERVLPGHGPPFGDHRAVIDGLVAFYGKRQARILALLAGGPRTGYEITRDLFPRAREGDLFLTVSEAVANLEVLEARGAVARAEEGGVYRFRLSG
ncbi:MBL fold metallo-hydrolase [Anaeromyxobacter paludicola]|uniref:MBL fold metallo-hydrolase n=1 Tax=Anaeromyxobacter paludicola TaxID=2918171 RepID=A0ABN6N926_9BACT|nr:MBL fold metallo-hydrolase [Anaeromyxobacter paludicola]BDG09744.1 MBL fold metallo-hydrolase [Anaeromyxobacter paludicola]